MKDILIFNNVYIKESVALGGPKEAKGPLNHLFDELYSDLHMGQKTFEQAEIYLQREVVAKLLAKSKKNETEIEVVFGGDLINQEIISNYALREYEIPFVGLFGACSTSVLGMILGALYLEHQEDKYAISMTSSHNATSERQFRNPTEYGGAKALTTTSTVTGSAGFILSNEKTEIKISKGLFGKIIDVGATDMFDMGRAMAPAACESLIEFFEKTNTTPKDYDLILTGDLSEFGSQIVRNILNEKYNYSVNYNDCGLMIYDRKQQNVFAGGSGCACCGCVMATYVMNEFKNKKLDRVLIAATGALMNAMMTLQKESIPAISHVILLERTL